MIHVRSSRGKNKKGRKVTGIEEMPGEDKVNLPLFSIIPLKNFECFKS
jgi:hypothetical protein